MKVTVPRRWLMRVALLAAGGILGLVGAEFLVRQFVPVRDVGPSLTVYDPVYGQRLKTDFRCVRATPDFRMDFRSNSLGWRGPELAQGRAEIVFLGDSFTMGHGVSDGREFPQLVARALGVPVVNMGIGGTGTGRWPVVLRGEATLYEPRTVVLQLCSNDIGDNLVEGLASLGPDGTLALHPAPSPSIGRRLQSFVELVPGAGSSHLLGLLRQSRIRSSHEFESTLVGSKDTRGLALTKALLEEAIRRCVEQGWQVVVLSADMGSAEAEPFIELCQRVGVAFVRMPSKREAPELYFELDGHWNETGHRHAAKLLEPLLR